MAGATRADYLLGTLRAGDDATVIGEALAEVEKVAWHLSWDGSRWRFITEPNANAIIAEEMRNVSNSRDECRARRSHSPDLPDRRPHQDRLLPGRPGFDRRRAESAPGSASTRRSAGGG